GLGLAPTGPFINAACVLGGLLLFAGVIGIFQGIGETGTVSRWGCTALLALSPLGMVVCGTFTLESFFLHFVGFLLGVATPVPGFLATGLVLRRIPRWRRLGTWLLLGSPLTLLLVILSLVSFDPVASGAGLGVAGLTERILVVEVDAWFVALSWLAFRRS